MTSRPGRIKEEVAIPIPRPRSVEVVMEPEFIALKRKILELLKNEIHDEGE